MGLAEIENLTHAELKSQKADLVAKAAEADKSELASRYVQARTDAAMRDEKLAEQARTLANLNDSLDAAQAKIAGMQTQLNEAGVTSANLTAKVTDLKLDLDVAKAQQAVEKQSSEDHKAASARFSEAAQSAHKILSDVVQVS